MIYEINRSYEFPIVGGGDPADESFFLEVQGPQGPVPVLFSKLKFQRDPNYKAPERLMCRVKNIDANGLPVLKHDIANYVYELYKEKQVNGALLEAKVQKVPDNPAEEPVEVRDEYGIVYRIEDKEGMLTRGQTIRCQFKTLEPRYFLLARTDEGENIPFHSPRELFTNAGVGDGLYNLFMAFLNVDHESVRILAGEIKKKNPLWPLKAVLNIINLLPDWLHTNRDQVLKRTRALRQVSESLRKIILYLLEGSNFLNAATSDRRISLQKKFTETIESLEPFFVVLDLIERDKCDSFVESMLDKLQRSGYIYHPKRQFAGLMLIFKIYPDKVAKYLNPIFDSIFSRSIENWQREPFQSAFLQQFDIYVRQARHEIDTFPVAETREQKTRIETIITAIALQLTLAHDDPNYKRSWSLFYRYISLLRPISNETLLTKSFLSILGEIVNRTPTYNSLKQPLMMMTEASVMFDGDAMSKIKSSYHFNSGSVNLDISSDGMVLSNSTLKENSGRLLSPVNMPWLSPQIRLDNIRTLLKTGTKLPDLKKWWAEVESSLFEKTSDLRLQKQLPRPETGDLVYVTISGMEDGETKNPTFLCTVHDSEYASVEGKLKLKNIVGYGLRYPNMDGFFDSKGQLLGYLVTTIVEPDGSYSFSMLDQVGKAADDYFDYDEVYCAVVSTPPGQPILAVCKEGFGVALVQDNKNEIYKEGDYVYFRKRKIHTSLVASDDSYELCISGRCKMEEQFNKTQAFYNLMQYMGEMDESPEVPAGNGGDQMLNMDEMLSPEDIREIIEVIRFRAFTQNKPATAYNYLRFAAILARLIGEDSLRTRLLTHAELLAQYDYFAINSRVDSPALESLREDAQTDPMLHDIFRRLEIVSWIGDRSRDREIFDVVSNPSTELDATVARLVMASNMMGENDEKSLAVVSKIKDLLKEQLNVNNETKHGKYYGNESKFIEFKTSLVYPAVAPGQPMVEDPARQQFHILSRIAGMLNADGGTLYIGVDNDGQGVGMHDDFEYYKKAAKRNQGLYDGKNVHIIKDREKLSLFVENLINNRFEKKVARKVEVKWDTDTDKDVLVITIGESLDPVFIDNRLFVRQGGQSTREYHGKDIDDFVNERKMLRAEREQISELNQRLRDMELDENAGIPATTVQAPDTPELSRPRETPQTSAEPEAETAAEPRRKDALMTSAWRPNVLHEFEDNFVQPSGYLYFMPDGLYYSADDKWHDTNEKCRLALVIPHKLADGFLVLGFQGERAMRIPLSEIYDRGEDIAIPLPSAYPLMFAAVASKDDILVCVFADSGSHLWVRSLKVASIEAARLNASPECIHKADMDHTFMWEIAEPEAISYFSESMDEKLGAKRAGYTLRLQENTPRVESKITELISKCHPGL